MTAFSAPVRTFMSRELVSVTPTTTLGDITALLEKRDISAVPVVDDAGVLRGVVSMTDILRASSDSVAVPLAAHVLRHPPITVDADAPLREAAEKMAHNRIHRVVVTEGGRAVGILSTRDAMMAIIEERVLTPVREVTTTSVESVDVGDSVDAALGRLEKANVRGLIVLDDGWPVGVFTQTEALRARALPASFRANTVESVMSYETICMDAATSLYRVAKQARAVRVRRILVVEKRHLYGIATGFDLVRHIATAT